MSLLNTSNQGSQVQPLDDSVPISRPANSELSPDDPEPRPLGTAPSRPSDPVSDMQEPVSKSLNSATVMGEPCERLQPLTPPTRSRSSRANIRRHRRSLYRSVGGDESDEDENEKSHKKREGIKCELSDGMLKLDDSDDEVVRLCHSRGSKLLDPLGREQPFPAMVNREMLCTLVRRAFNQTEEQQIQYDQILRHENGRKSKGEVRRGGVGKEDWVGFDSTNCLCFVQVIRVLDIPQVKLMTCTWTMLKLFMHYLFVPR